MLKLKLQKTVKKVNFKKVKNAFNNQKVVLYSSHKDDSRKVFIQFIIVDSKSETLTYYNSYLPENVAIIDKYEKTNNIKLFVSDDPHCTIKINENDFYCFIQEPKFFYRVNMQTQELFMYIWKDDVKIPNIWQFLRFSPTNFLDPDDKSKFIFSWTSKKGDKIYYNIIRADLGFKNLELLHTYEKEPNKDIICHTIKKYKWNIFLSNFDDVYFDIKYYNEVFDEEKLKNDIIPLYKDYLKYKKLYDKLDLNSWKSKILWEKLFNKFKEDTSLKNLPDDLFTLKEFDLIWFIELIWVKFSVQPWTIKLFDEKSFKDNVYNTKYCRPAHFEIDESEDMIYISSHNFVTLDRRYYIWPAAIDKYKIIGNKLEKISTFEDDKWYRYTSHRVFDYNWKKYLVTIWQPNRLFVVDANKMKIIYTYDLWDGFLSQEENARCFLNSYTWYSFVAIEVLNNWILMLVSDYDIVFFDIEKKEIIEKMAYLQKDSNFVRRNTHIQVL